MRIAVYGGTFNPIHNAHLHWMRSFAEAMQFDRIILMPSHTPPHKSGKALASPEDRLAMCRLAVANEAFPVEVSEMEIRRGGASYTADTLEALHRENPQDELFLLMGEDMFLSLAKWYDPQRIFRYAKICAAPRSREGLANLAAYEKTLAALGAQCFLKEIAYLPVSSTMVREAVRARKSIRALVPEAVAAYIETHGLYRAQEA